MIDPRAYAVLIGIDHVGGGLSKLDGPAADAIRLADILIQRGLPASRIRLFIDRVPADVNPPAAVQPEEPTESVLTNFFRNTLPKIDASDLILLWGGHGMVAWEDRRTFFSDSTLDNRVSLNFDDLRKYLASESIPPGRMATQILIADVCADVKNLPHGVPGVTFNSKAARQEINQFVLFAARTGQTAANLNREKTGLLSREFMNALKNRPKEEWPWEMKEIANRITAQFKELRRNSRLDQIPSYSWFRDASGDEITDAQSAVSPKQAKKIYLVIEVSAEPKAPQKYKFATSVWLDESPDIDPQRPAKIDKGKIRAERLLAEIGEWLNDYLLASDLEPVDYPRVVAELVLPRAWFDADLSSIAVCPIGEGTPYVPTLQRDIPWALRAPNYRGHAPRNKNLARRWTAPTQLEEVAVIDELPSELAEEYRAWSCDTAGAPPLRCVGLRFPLPAGPPEEDILLALSAAGVPAVVWFRNSGESNGLQVDIRDKLLNTKLEDLPSELLSIRNKKENSPWKAAVLVLDHHKRMGPIKFKEPTAHK